MVNLGIKDRIPLKSVSLGHVPMMKLEDWDLVDSNISLAKMQHKLQQKLSILDQRSQDFCSCTKSSCL